MKRCPSCDSIYLDEYVYCLSDGAALISDMADQPDADTKGRSDGRSAQMPRRAFNPILIYLAIGALTLVAGGLFALDRFSGSSSDTGKIGSSSTDKDYLSSAAQTSIPSPSNRTPFNTKETSGSQPPLTTESVKELLGIWEQGQDGRNFQSYQSCYDPSFTGVKTVKNGKSQTYQYDSWMADRRRMFGSAVNLNVDISNLQIRVEGDQAVAEFEQIYRSLRYSDHGPKEIRIKMTQSGPKIIYEILKDSSPL